MPHQFLPAVLVALLVLPPSPVPACPFCGVSGQTLTQEMDQAAFVIYGSMKNARLTNPKGDGFPMGETDLVLDDDVGILKPHKYLEGKKIITLPKYIPDTKEEDRFLIFCDIFRGKLDPYRGLPVKASSAMPRYLKGALANKKDRTSERLKFFFNYLQNEESEIANDAIKEFGNASHDDVEAMASTLPAEKIAGWLKDKHTPPFRIGLYGSLLGRATSKRSDYADLLRSLVRDPENRAASGVDGILAGQVMLEPTKGWDYLKGVLGDRKHDFNYRYAALKAARFFIDHKTGVIERKQVIEAIAQMLAHPDIVDLVIEDLRRWKAWDYTKAILAFQENPKYDVGIVRRATLRFMLQSDKPEAKKYVADARADDPDRVSNLEDVLKAEEKMPPPPSK